jgi:hypothetical protein
MPKICLLQNRTVREMAEGRAGCTEKRWGMGITTGKAVYPVKRMASPVPRAVRGKGALWK